jgi:hypothetical protein
MLNLSQFAAVAIGAFYVFAGVVVVRAMALDRVMDQLLAALNEPSAPKELLKTRVLTIGAYSTLASGAALMLLSPLAPVLFAANALWQGGYLLWAERALRPEDDDEARGRRQTKNAFVVYLAATAFVGWLAAQGLLRSWDVPLQSHAIDVAVIIAAVLAGWAVVNLRARKRGGAYPDVIRGTSAADAVLDPLPKRLRLAPAWGRSPLCDDETGVPLSPYVLDLPDELASRIDQWDDMWQATYNPDDPAAGGFQDEEAAEVYRFEGREIAAALKEAWAAELVVQLPEN